MSEQAHVRQLLVFRLGALSYGLPVADVKETLQYTVLTELPLGSGLIKGIMNVRGTLLPVVDSRKLLRMVEEVPPAGACIILLKRGDRTIGLITDSVPEVLTLGALECHLGTGVSEVSDLVQSPDGSTMIRMLDCAWIFSCIDDAISIDIGQTRDRERHITSERVAVSDHSVVEDELIVHFRAAGTDYGLRASDIQRVLTMPEELESMPGMPDALLGVTMDRGSAVPVWHAGAMLGETEPSKPTRVLLIELRVEEKQARVGLAVDRSDQLVRVSKSSITELPMMLRGKDMGWVTGLCEVSGRLTFLLDIHRWHGWNLVEREWVQATDTTVEAVTSIDSDKSEEELYVFFQIEQTMYGIRAAEVKEVLKETEMTPVPDAKCGAVGILNIRGHLVTVVNMAAHLGHGSGGLAGGRMIVIQSGLDRLAFTVDDVRHLRRVGRKELKPVQGLDVLGHEARVGASHPMVTEWKTGHYASILQGNEMFLIEE